RDIDQPWLRTGPSNHVYMAGNDFSNGNGETASVFVSTDGGSSYNEVVVDRVGGAAGQDAPAVRLAVNGNTVYSAFTRWDSFLDTDGAREDRYNSHVVIVRSDNGGADNFGALGAGGNGVTVATPRTYFANTSNGPLTLGQERTGSDLAIAVDPNNASHVVLAYGDAPGATGSGNLRLHVTESFDGGVMWTEKFISSSTVRAALPALAINNGGAVGLLYATYDPTSDKISDHFLTTTNDFANVNDTLLSVQSNATPASDFDPYIGDFFDLTAVGTTFYGIFCASNADNGTDAQFSSVAFQRNFTGTPGTSNFHVADSMGNPVAFSIDPFFFSYQLDTTAPAFVHLLPLTVAVGATATISSSLLQVDDPDDAHAQLNYAVTTAPAHGILMKNGVATSSFTQTDIDNGLISYREDDVVASDKFAFNVSDPAGNITTGPFNFQITINPGGPFRPVTPWDVSWSPIASGDFNHDGNTDVIWDNGHGVEGDWLMANATRAATIMLPFFPDWHTVGTGDFNADGTTDIMWQNPDGLVAEWFMGNGTRQGTQTI